MPYGSKATSYVNAGIPVDQPRLIRDGVMHREADFHGSAKYLDSALPLEHPERAKKGDLPESSRPAPRSSFESNGDLVPFAFLTPRTK